MNLDSLRELIRQSIERNGQDRARPSWIANDAMEIADPEKISPVIVRYAAHLEFKQIAREELRRRFAPENPDEPEPQQHPLFEGLQAMYPRRVQEGEEPEYVRPELLSKEDVSWNVGRIRKCANSLLRGADSLEAWARERGLAA